MPLELLANRRQNDEKFEAYFKTQDERIKAEEEAKSKVENSNVKKDVPTQMEQSAPNLNKSSEGEEALKEVDT
jgi:uncharacterized protein HemX